LRGRLAFSPERSPNRDRRPDHQHEIDGRRRRHHELAAHVASDEHTGQRNGERSSPASAIASRFFRGRLEGFERQTRRTQAGGSIVRPR
jgi:hypothetical protein